MNRAIYLSEGFQRVGFMYRQLGGKKKHNTYVEWNDNFFPEGKMGVYIMCDGEEVMKIGETQNLRHRFQCYESHSGPTNSMVRESMEETKVYTILFIECPSFEVGFAGVKVPSGINYRILEKKLLEQYVAETQVLPKWNKGIQ